MEQATDGSSWLSPCPKILVIIEKKKKNANLVRQLIIASQVARSKFDATGFTQFFWKFNNFNFSKSKKEL